MNILNNSFGAVSFFARLPKWAKVVSAVFAFTSMHNYALLVGLDVFLVRIVDPTFFAPVLWDATSSFLLATIFVYFIQVVIVVAARLCAGLLRQARFRNSYSSLPWGRVAPDFAINLCIFLCFLLFYLGGEFVKIFINVSFSVIFLEVAYWFIRRASVKREARWTREIEQRPIGDRIDYLAGEIAALEHERENLSLATAMVLSFVVVVAAITAGFLKAEVLLRSSQVVRVVLQGGVELSGGLVGRDKSSIFISQDGGVRVVNWSEVGSVVREGTAPKTSD